eukprot:832330-Prymnesium_polylepis.1
MVRYADIVRNAVRNRIVRPQNKSGWPPTLTKTSPPLPVSSCSAPGRLSCSAARRRSKRAATRCSTSCSGDRSASSRAPRARRA